MKRNHLILSAISLIALAFLSANLIDPPKQYKWSGAWIPTRISAGDGITELDTKIGRFITLPDKQSHLNLIRNINKKFPGSKPWATWTVGDLSRAIPTGQTLSDKQHEAYLSCMDEQGITIFLEIFPFKADEKNNISATDPGKEIDFWLHKFKHHKCVAGIGVELEYFGKATDALASVWDKKVKSHNPAYRLFLRHYNKEFMPPTYRGKGDLIFIGDASEGTIESLSDYFAEWANHFSPAACAFQIGYPADEDGMNGSKELGWWRLNDPVKDWGNMILPKVKNENQEIGLIWVTAKSGKSYNTWDLTK